MSHFFGYLARGVPDRHGDGTISPWAVIASLSFAPETVVSVLSWFDDLELRIANPYGLKATFNPTFLTDPARGRCGYLRGTSAFHQRPIIAMTENFRSGLLWRLMQQCLYLVSGLRRAGLTGGWLGA